MGNKVLSYEDKKYKQSDNIYDSLSQAFENFKDNNNQYQWNLPTEQLKGTTMRLLGDHMVEFTFGRVEFCSLEEIQSKKAAEANKFLSDVMNGVKKEFRALTKKSLKLTKVKDNDSVEKVSLYTSSSERGYAGGVQARFLLRNSRVYKFDEELLDD